MAKAKKSRARSSNQQQFFHAVILVTRAEEWCMEASSAAEAEQLLAAGHGHRCHSGECVMFQFENIIED